MPVLQRENPILRFKSIFPQPLDKLEHMCYNYLVITHQIYFDLLNMFKTCISFVIAVIHPDFGWKEGAEQNQ